MFSGTAAPLPALALVGGGNGLRGVEVDHNHHQGCRIVLGAWQAVVADILCLAKCVNHDISAKMRRSVQTQNCRKHLSFCVD